MHMIYLAANIGNHILWSWFRDLEEVSYYKKIRNERDDIKKDQGKKQYSYNQYL